MPRKETRGEGNHLQAREKDLEQPSEGTSHADTLISDL